MVRMKLGADVLNERIVRKKLKVLVQGEGLARSRGLGGGCGGGRGVDSSLGVIRHAFLEEIGLALERDHIHKVKGVRHVVYLVISKSHEESVSNELNILAHELGVHPDQGNWEGI